MGARPTPSIGWWKGSTQLRNTKEWVMIMSHFNSAHKDFFSFYHCQTSSDGNLTRSILTYQPVLEDQGKYLSCRAEQTAIPESGIEDGFKLDIHRK